MPKDVTVTFKDGTAHIYRNAPDDITPDEVEARALRDFGKPLASLSRGAAAPSIKRAGYTPEGMLHDLAKPSRDAAASLDQRVAEPLKRRFNNLRTGNVKGVIDDLKSLPAEVPLANLAGIEAMAAIPNGVVNMFARPWTDLGADTAYNAGIRADKDVAANREKVNQGVGLVGSVASMIAGGLPKAPPKVPAGFKPPAKLPKPVDVRTQRVQALQRTGIDLTPGQLMGGQVQKLEDAVATTSGSVTRAKTRANEQLNNAVMNDALAPIGGKVKGAGRDAVEAMHTQVSDALNASFSNVRFVPDAQFKADITRAAKPIRPNDRAEALEIAKDFLKDASAQNSLGEAYSTLTKMKTQAARDGHITLADFIDDLQASVLDNLDRTGTGKESREIRAAREAFRKSLIPERAAAMTGATEGVPNPNQLFAAVKASDRTVRKNAFAQGKAQYQDVAEAAKDVMGSTMGSSGTAERLSLKDPFRYATLTARNVALGFVYNKPVLKALNDISRAKSPSQAATGISALRQLALKDPDAAKALAAITGSGNAFGQSVGAAPNMLGAAAAENTQQKPR